MQIIEELEWIFQITIELNAHNCKGLRKISVSFNSCSLWLENGIVENYQVSLHVMLRSWLVVIFLWIVRALLQFNMHVQRVYVSVFSSYMPYPHVFYDIDTYDFFITPHCYFEKQFIVMSTLFLSFHFIYSTFQTKSNI